MHTSLVTCLLALAMSACAMPADDSIATLENATGKADGSAMTAVTLSSEHPSAAMRFVCDERWYDRCTIVLDVSLDWSSEDAARTYMHGLGYESSLDIAGIRVTQPDGTPAEITLYTGEEERPTDVIAMEARYSPAYDGATPSLFAMLEGEHMHPGQFEITSWQDGEYLVELFHLATPASIPDQRTLYVSAYWE